MPYEIHPTQESIVCTPDGGVIECKHEAAAKRVCAELNERDNTISMLVRGFSALGWDANGARELAMRVTGLAA